jgi:prolipoprotein diacylglyceryl transferase
MLTFIPSPPDNAIHLGPLQLHAYGLMIALGVVAAVWLAGRRLEQRGVGTNEDMSSIAMWAVPAGIVGARLYHVITDWKSFQGDWLRAFKIWDGGLGIWGGVALGMIVGLWAARKRGVTTAAGFMAVAPALPLAQAIGRVGNWWNQELFGRPSTLPWALKIDSNFRPDQYKDFATFHPAFLYESLWNLALCGVILRLDRKRNIGAGKLFAIYVAGYTFIRFFIERLRVDFASKLLGLRVNEWVSGIVFLIALAYLLTHRKQQWVQHDSVAVDGDDSDAEASDVEAEASDVTADATLSKGVVGLAGATVANDGDVDAEAAPEDSTEGAAIALVNHEADDDDDSATVTADDDDLATVTADDLLPAKGIEDDLGAQKLTSRKLGLDQRNPLVD